MYTGGRGRRLYLPPAVYVQGVVFHQQPVGDQGPARLGRQPQKVRSGYSHDGTMGFGWLVVAGSGPGRIHRSKDV